MPFATLTSKGQITLPADMRRLLKLEAGDRVLFVEEDGAWRLIPANSPVTALKGIIPRPAKPVSLEDIEDATHEGWSRRFKAPD
jgi:antitoxin PrlF